MKRISFQVSALALILAVFVEGFVPPITKYSRPALLFKPGLLCRKRSSSRFPLVPTSPLPQTACNIPSGSAITMSIQPSNRDGVLRRLVRCGGLSCLTNSKRRYTYGKRHRTASLLKSATETDEYDKDAEEDYEEYDDEEEYDDGLDG